MAGARAVVETGHELQAARVAVALAVVAGTDEAVRVAPAKVGVASWAAAGLVEAEEAEEPSEEAAQVMEALAVRKVALEVVPDALVARVAAARALDTGRSAQHHSPCNQIRLRSRYTKRRARRRRSTHRARTRKHHCTRKTAAASVAVALAVGVVGAVDLGLPVVG